MKKMMLMDKYPVYTSDIPKSATNIKSVDEIVKYFIKKIEEDDEAVFISLFDHFAHTKSLEDCEINPEIKDAKDIVFCFGKKLPNPYVVGVRPRSIGVCETENSFVISFLEAPNPEANEKMQNWAKEIL
ncbi:DUF6858 family protein [Nitrosophilus alvini]|uniref:DUF6858 family protein n=1 Tax=Nitrosophilus alvini TaxID=2714855 RepID=UPI00190A03C8|nr:hypothetical protein [Nitrosophilus alvini]